MIGNYPIITLCGSTRFKDAFLEAQKRLTLEGYIVISVGLFGHSGDNEVWEDMSEGTRTRTKEMLDDMHRRKIDLADEIYVINVDDYIGESTRSEIAYAREHGKIVRYLEPHVEKGTLAMGAVSGPTSYFVAGKVDDNYEEAEAFLRQTLQQGAGAAGVYPADEATAAMIAYQLDEEPESARAVCMEDLDAAEIADAIERAGDASEESGEDEDPQAGKKAYVVQMLRDGYDIGNIAYFIGEDETFVREVMKENGIAEV